MKEVKVIQNNKLKGEYKNLEYWTLPEGVEFEVTGHIWGDTPEQGEFTIETWEELNHGRKRIVTLHDCKVTQWLAKRGNHIIYRGRCVNQTWKAITELSGPPLVNKALEIAQKAHQLQLDKAGEPYILHPIRVMNLLWEPGQAIDQTERYKVMAAALLHDALEDTEIWEADLLAFGIPEEVVIAVQYLTHYPHMNYRYYINKVCGNPIALQVKKADLADNLRPDRLKLLGEETRTRLVKKYHQALEQIDQYETKTIREE